MKRLFLSIALFFGLSFLVLKGQNAMLMPGSPRSTGMGKTSLSFSDQHSLFGNQAGLANLEELAVMGMVEQRFLLSDLRHAAIGAAIPSFSGVFGLTLRSFGGLDYRESGAGLAYARKLSDRLRIGGKLHWDQISIAEYGKRSFFNLDFGIQAELLPKLWAAAQVRNAIRQQVLNREYTPSVFGAGLAYQPSAKVFLQVELIKDIDFPADIRVGIEYTPSKTIFLRAGASTAPGGWSFGFGVPILNNLVFDCAAAYHPYLGFTPSAGLAYRKKKS